MTDQMTQQESDFEPRLLLASLYLIMHIIDTEGEDAVSWYDDSLDARSIVSHLLKNDETRVNRLLMLVCTLMHT